MFLNTLWPPNFPTLFISVQFSRFRDAYCFDIAYEMTAVLPIFLSSKINLMCRHPQIKQNTQF